MNTIFCDKALQILGRTSDGDALASNHLKLVEIAVNGCLSSDGETAFEDLYQSVLSGSYVKPWLHGIEHLTADCQGYIYWKGIGVEHYDFPYEKSSAQSLQNIANRCLHIEALGIAPRADLVTWRWDWMKNLTADHKWLNFFSNSPDMWESDHSLVIVVHGNLMAHLCDGNIEFHYGIEEFLQSVNAPYDEGESHYRNFAKAGFSTPKAGQGDQLGLIYAPLDGVISILEKHRVPPNFFDVVGELCADLI